MNAISQLELSDLLALATRSVASPSANQANLLKQLDYLRERLVTQRFQLAVLGQFKRGKSTLLNTLLRADALPTGVIPVTAIATFLQYAKKPRLCVSYLSGKTEQFDASGEEALRERLRALVTEEANPKNALGVDRVDVFLPSELLQRGVVLIDTPGVGSTFRHNTAAADAILHECDATLFVVSPDPPITEVEIDFLSRIRETVAHLIIVLNKIDIVEPGEAESVRTFLQRVLTEQAKLDSRTPIFCISARKAFQAEQRGDAAALQESAFPELQSYLLQFLANEKRATLNAAVARKATLLVAQLQLETEIAFKSLRLPVEDLEKRMATFDEAAKQFDVERRTATDLLAGDRRRALEELETEAERLRTEARATLEHALDQALAADKTADIARQCLNAAEVAFFDGALRDVIRKVGVQLEEVLRIHQRRADDLITLVRQTAANLLEIPFRAPESSEAFETKRDPFWVTAARTAELNPIPPGTLDPLLPASLRKTLMRRRLIQEIDSVIVRNVENLRWATRQNVEDAFQRFSAELDERLAMSLAATRGAMQKALEQRKEHAEQTDAEMENKQRELTKLAEIEHALLPRI
jgi:GTPase Era involved in 16S rRNA processing